MDELRMVFNGMDIVDKLGTTKNGQPKLVIADVVGRSVTTVENETVGVPGKAGSHLLRSKEPQRVLEVPFILRGETHEQLRMDVNKLSELLITPSEANISFNDEPYTYYGKLEGEVPLTEHRTNAKGTLTFICPDPYKYGEEKRETFTEGHAVFNAGTAETSPVFRATAKQSATFLDIVKENGEYIRVGDPGRLEQEPYSRTRTVLFDKGTSVTGWTDASSADHGYVAGQMIGTPKGFHPQSFDPAISPYAWQGPVKKRSLPEPVGNFVLSAYVTLKNVGNYTGMIEFYLLDANNETVAKIGIEDPFRGRDLVQGKMQLGPDDADRYHEYTFPPTKWKQAWNNFEGILKLFRDDYSGEKRIRSYFTLIDENGNGGHYGTFKGYYHDVEGKYQTDVTQVQLAMRKWPSEVEAEMYVTDVKVQTYHTEPEGLPYIVEPGDVIEVDHKKAVIRINGEERNDLKFDFGSDYFKLVPGVNNVYIFPGGAFDTEITWRDAYK
ncbi:distal tail protein Dit [Salimicrobium jeotgali]|uniref:distal tail protein Dit n=1 Tax=Salimicrobium jeotgali TaxID=1230341 RepID=UPI000C85EEC0|nr:distal tail protein Dit [Salimicrobium jeotgali]